MRPVDKQYPPEEPARFTPAGGARVPEDIVRAALQDTIGWYCSFCEMPAYLGDVFASKRTRKLRRTPALSHWDDLLLTCDFCTLHRRGDVENLDDVLWPDVDATFSLDGTSPFVHTRHQATRVVLDAENGNALESEPVTLAVIEVNAGSPDAERARRTLDLFQLNSPYYDASSGTLTVDSLLRGSDDRRLALRGDAWSLAEKYAARIEEQMHNGTTRMLDLTIETSAAIAQACGFWSVWMTVLWDALRDPEILRRVLLSVDRRGGYMFTGYQTVPDGGKPPWRVFPGTAIERIRIPGERP